MFSGAHAKLGICNRADGVGADGLGGGVGVSVGDDGDVDGKDTDDGGDGQEGEFDGIEINVDNDIFCSAFPVKGGKLLSR